LALQSCYRRQDLPGLVLVHGLVHRQSFDLCFKPMNVTTLCPPLCNGRDAKFSHGLRVIRPALAKDARHAEVGGWIIAKKRIPGESPNVALLFAGWNGLPVDDPRLRTVPVHQALDQMNQLVADGLIIQLTYFEPDHEG